MFQVGDETSKSFVDPNPSVQTALTNIGLSSVLGGALGAGFGTVPALWEGSKASKFVDEFKSRVNEHLADPNLPNAPFDNLNKFYQDTKSGFKSLFSGEVTPEGERLEGIKNQAIDKKGNMRNKTFSILWELIKVITPSNGNVPTEN